MSKKQGVTISRDSGGSSDLWYRRAYDLVRPSADRPESGNNLMSAILFIAVMALAYESVVEKAPPLDDKHSVEAAQTLVTEMSYADAERSQRNILIKDGSAWLVGSRVVSIDGAPVQDLKVKRAGFGIDGESTKNGNGPSLFKP